MSQVKNRIIRALIAFLIFLLDIILAKTLKLEWYIELPICLVAYLIAGYDILWKAVRNISHGEVFDENFLMIVATIGAFATKQFEEGVMVMVLYQVGEAFQDYAVDKSRNSISSLMDLRPDYANLLVDGNITKVSPDEVEVGQTIVVKPGEKVPLDGMICEGSSNLDTLSLTGETKLRAVGEGDEVLSGSVNQDGLLKIVVSKPFADSTVAKILELVENASDKKAKAENFISKFAKYYTPIVVIAALILAILPPTIIYFVNGTNSYSDYIQRACSFLVISCPCALVISIPLGFFGGIGGASKMGILIKGSNYLEALSNVETVVFDKTGTLTKGVFEVQKVKPVGISEEELLKIVAYSEYYSNHPIAKSIKKAYGKEIDEKQIIKTQELSGLGISAKIGEQDVLIGNEKLMNEHQIIFSKCNDIGTILHVAIEREYVGYIVIADTIKEDSIVAIKELKKNNVKKTVMLTGDKKEVGESVSKELGIDEVYTELLPDGKVEKVEELLKKKSEKGKLAFVGDGINDSPVLALADIGIAMGGLGADSAIEAADIVIMTDEPSKIVKAIKLSKKTMRIVKENIIFAIFIKIAVLILAALGISTML